MLGRGLPGYKGGQKEEDVHLTWAIRNSVTEEQSMGTCTELGKPGSADPRGRHAYRDEQEHKGNSWVPWEQVSPQGAWGSREETTKGKEIADQIVKVLGTQPRS